MLHGRERLVCPACQFIFWQNPVVGVAVIVLQDDHIVLARRGAHSEDRGRCGSDYAGSAPLLGVHSGARSAPAGLALLIRGTARAWGV